MFHIFENGIYGHKVITLYVDPGDRPETPANGDDRKFRMTSSPGDRDRKPCSDVRDMEEKTFILEMALAENKIDSTVMARSPVYPSDHGPYSPHIMTEQHNSQEDTMILRQKDLAKYVVTNRQMMENNNNNNGNVPGKEQKRNDLTSSLDPCHISVIVNNETTTIKSQMQSFDAPLQCLPPLGMVTRMVSPMPDTSHSLHSLEAMSPRPDTSHSLYPLEVMPPRPNTGHSLKEMSPRPDTSHPIHSLEAMPHRPSTSQSPPALNAYQHFPGEPTHQNVQYEQKQIQQQIQQQVISSTHSDTANDLVFSTC